MADPQAVLGLLRHPLRREILQHFVEMDEPLNPDRVSKEIGTRLNNVSYHIGVLANAGALTLTEERPARGSLAHVYVVNEGTVTREPWVREALGLPRLPEEPGDEDE